MTLQKPLVLGNFLIGGGEMAWAWCHENHSRLAIVGDNELSPKRQLIRDIAKMVNERDNKAVYWITGEEPPAAGEIISMDVIPWVDSFPDPPQELEGREQFINDRKFLVSSFFTLLAGIKGVGRTELIPPASYRGHMEGPMSGYMTAINGLSDNDAKTWLLDYTKTLELVDWVKSIEEGTKYYIPRNGNLYESALGLLKAVWSIWAFIGKQDVPQQFLLIVEPPKELLKHDINPEILKIVEGTLDIFRRLSLDTTSTVILASEMLYPAPEHFYRFKLLFQTKDSDIDLMSTANQQSLDMPELYTEWKNGNSQAGLWIDEYSGQQYPIKINNNLEFWDDFVETAEKITQA